jgi:hypothetical protein
VLRIQCKNGFEDQLSIRNSDSNPNTGIGVFAERRFYKGSVISLYVGQPVWIASAAGCNIPMESYVREALQTAGYPFAASDETVAVRDLRGRVYAVNSQPYVHPELTIHAHNPEIAMTPRVVRLKQPGDDEAPIIEHDTAAGDGANVVVVGNVSDDGVNSVSSSTTESNADAWKLYASTHPYLGAHFIRKVGFGLPRGADEYEAAMATANAEVLEDGVVVANMTIEAGQEILLKCPALLREDEIAALVANTANKQVQAAAGLREMIEEDSSDDNGTQGMLLCRRNRIFLTLRRFFHECKQCAKNPQSRVRFRRSSEPTARTVVVLPKWLQQPTYVLAALCWITPGCFSRRLRLPARPGTSSRITFNRAGAMLYRADEFSDA